MLLLIMAQTIELQAKDVFGTLRYYPVCPLAKQLIKLKDNKKTFTVDDLKTLKIMSYTIKWTPIVPR